MKLPEQKVYNLSRDTFPPKIIFGLKSKFSFVIALFLLLIFGLMAFILVQNSNDNLTKQVTSEAKSYANLSNKPIVEAYKLYFDSGYLKFREILSTLLALNTNISRVVIYDANGLLLVDSRDLPVGKPPSQNKQPDQSIITAAQGLKPLYINNKTNNQIGEIIYPHEDSWGNRSFVVKYFVSYDQVLTSVNKIKTNIIILAVFSLIISFIVISWLIGRIILNPIEIVHQGALLISQGKFDHEIEVKTRDEVEELATSVNKMAKKLQKDIESLQQVDKLKDEFITIATHHLRTPITAIKGYLSFLGKGRLGELNEEQSKYVKVITQS
ncbi:HAMP domain-containing protein, partial [Patescibacteria group bacterium]|nr:HAMP domain-containing protein [Patescibacteria group bacterium]